jgi:hydrogenase nickel incorporation protein HypB
MCGVCGCGAKADETAGHSHEAGGHEHPHDHEGGHTHAEHDGQHSHPHVHATDDHGGHTHHDHPHDHRHDGSHEHAHGDRGHEARLVKVERDILDKNNHLAAHNRALLADSKTLALNLVSSPGAGKTSLLVRTLRDLAGKVPVAVIEGDQQTSLDADRIQATGAPALQVNTGKMCHLDAEMVGEAMARLGAPQGGVLFIENVGNLVCPAGFDLGEAGKVVLASVTEGEDKPLKYPDMFHAARLVLITKVDLLPHLDFDVDALEKSARRVNPRAEVLRVSARTGEGMSAWYAWIEAMRRGAGGA